MVVLNRVEESLAGIPNQLRRLSRSSLLALGILLLTNVALVIFILAAGGTREVSAVSEPVLAPGLRLLRELSEAERKELEPAEVVNERALSLEFLAEEPAKLSAVCRIWGPFTNMDTLKRVEEAVADAGQVVEIKTDEIKSTPDFLVYIESDNNADNARRLLRELAGQSLDAYIIAGGDFMNSVSAGVFSTQARAEQQVSKLTDLGYSAEIEALERIQTVFHLIGLVPEGFEAESQNHSDCPAIASAQ
ncbi:MAG: SPOR domain-containing protein [Pseudomonadales bacterium]